MSESKLNEILNILSRYNSNGSVDDYYQLFSLDKNMTAEEIKTQIKKMRLQVLFHPDQLNFVPTQYHQKYLQMIEVVKDAINVFDSYQSKENYDIKLEESKNSYSTYNSYNQSDNYEDKTEDLDEANLQQAIILNSQKYGFEHTRRALVELIQYNYADGFTRQNNVRQIISNIDREKLKSILLSSSLNDKVALDLEQIVMNYLTDLVDKMPMLNIQQAAIKEACVTTMVKYDLAGRGNQTNEALNRFSDFGDANGFTNTNNCRVNLVNNVDYKNVKFFVQCALNKKRHEQPRFSYQYTKNLTPDYINKLYCDETMQKLKEDMYGNSGYGDNSSYGR